VYRFPIVNHTINSTDVLLLVHERRDWILDLYVEVGCDLDQLTDIPTTETEGGKWVLYIYQMMGTFISGHLNASIIIILHYHLII
jgi:hypothetical protein